ncbi:alpha/beta hydrolase [Aliiglaciecola sp. LCG003]|uniref:alpha/beta fold hydrolase n=1 Tax=Aliiglaciecola sp. LCG003 TaxID=3053655 RepID=UPI002573D5FB|nr:alpha/beta hydrolase [Aliiglaciecola sp. LCG003]WJG10211.1 alpha/beta hydrolase [Aliiglaciecola sp. LCG003]
MTADLTGQEQIAEINGISICYETFGEPHQPALLLIMGLATQMIHWDDNFCQLLAEQGFRVIRFDNRDIGKSSHLKGAQAPSLTSVLANQWFGKKLKAPYTLDTMAEDAIALMDHLKIEKFHVVGVSMGGMIAQCIAIKQPNRTMSLTSIMSTTGNQSLPKPKKSVMLKVMQPPPKEHDAYIKYALGLWKLLHGQRFPFYQERMTKLLERAKERSFYPAGVWRQTCAILASEDRTKALQKLHLPTLVMHGDADPLVPVECGKATAEAINNAHLRVFPGMGHTLPEELWQQMIKEILDVVARADAIAS